MWIDRPSPNHDARVSGRRPDLVILHYTGLPTIEDSLTRLTDPAARVSCHYFVDEAGQLYRLVDEDRRAWHAGASFWQGERDVNSRSIGIELQNPGHEFGYRDFPDEQIAALERLLGDLKERYELLDQCFLGHSDVAPERKIDPGEKFPWPRLAKRGFGLWPFDSPGGDADGEAVTDSKLESFIRHLSDIGFAVDLERPASQRNHAAIGAFQRHWRPGRVDGIADAETCARAELLAGLVRRNI